MAYTRTNWTSTTPINTKNLNNIESGIETNSISIGDLSKLTTEEKSNLVNAINEASQTGGGETVVVNTTKKESDEETYSCNYINGTVLFENVDGLSESITLSESAENFSFLEIAYKCNTYGYRTERIYDPNGKKVVLEYLAVANVEVNQLSSSIFLINETAVTLQSSCLINHSLKGYTKIVVEQGNDIIKITKIVGYK